MIANSIIENLREYHSWRHDDEWHICDTTSAVVHSNDDSVCFAFSSSMRNNFLLSWIKRLHVDYAEKSCDACACVMCVCVCGSVASSDFKTTINEVSWMQWKWNAKNQIHSNASWIHIINHRIKWIDSYIYRWKFNYIALTCCTSRALILSPQRIMSDRMN